MTPLKPDVLKLLALIACLPFWVTAQETGDNPLDNFDGSKQEITEVDKESREEDTEESPGSGKVSLGELSKDQINTDKMSESLENKLESEIAKGNVIEELIKESLDKTKPALSSTGLELNVPDVFPTDI